MSKTPGQLLAARFVLVRALGEGGTGQAWLAQDRDLGGHVVLKFLAPAFAAQPDLVAALARESEQQKSLVHPHIVRVDGLYRDGDLTWIAMEYLAGGDLTQFRGRPATDILRFALPVAEALAYAHAAGVVHRDVKTANVLVGMDGQPRLADFGMASVAGSQTGLGLGSPYSMSPQQAAGMAPEPADDVYAFGVLLYELLTGYPPFYPDIDASRRNNEPPPPLKSRYPVPDALAALTDRCLAKQPDSRPGMQEVAEELGGLLRSMSDLPKVSIAPPVLRPPASVEQPLQAKWERSTQAAGPSSAELRSEGFRRGLVMAALVLLIAAAGVVFFVLPERVADQQAVAVPAPAPTVPETSQVAAAPVDLEALAVLKQQADEQQAQVLPRVAALEQRAVAEWGGQGWSALQAGLASTAERYAARDFAAATAGYEGAAKQLDVLERQAGEVLGLGIARGNTALDEGRAAAAQEAFTLALKLAPAQAEATRGLARAQSLDAVMALVNQAELDEKEGKIAPAADSFAKALQLDSDTRRARDGLARVQGRLAGDAYAAAMARGFAALASRDFGAAKRAFESARTLRPQAPEVQQALAQVEQEERTAIIAGRLASARTHEGAERWQQALADYQAVLQLDATVAAAQQGVERTRPRAELNDELQLYVTQPERLFSAPVRETARAALMKARAIAAPGPVLQQQVTTLDGWLQQVTIPVQVALESDNLTSVTIYRVGELGLFTRRAVELTPGRYTVVGTRPGFRDVRREIMVAPGETPAPIVIRCEDRI